MYRRFLVTRASAIAIAASAVALIGASSPDWQPKRAAEYLDARCRAWMEFRPAGRGTGATASSCVSCHTSLPYMLARPVLRKSTKERDVTEFEIKMLDQTKKRVEAWTHLDTAEYRLLYDFNDDKKKESWGTESVLNALVLAFDDQYRGVPTPTDITRKAFANLWKEQIQIGDNRGTWNWLNFGLEPWEAPKSRYFGACLAAIAVGSAPGYYSSGKDPALDRQMGELITYLDDHFRNENLHNRVWRMWAAAVSQRAIESDLRKQFFTEIVAKQQDDGGWSLASLGDYVRGDDTSEDRASDGYATGLVVHVLLLAGVSADDPQIAQGLKWLRQNQLDSGQWRTASVNKKRDLTSHTGQFMSDAATAFAVLALSH
jgi:squalene-hopene/tetraprenyl-beta-curcumene cyclase